MEIIVFLVITAVFWGIARSFVDRIFPPINLRGKKKTPLLGVVAPKQLKTRKKVKK